MPTSRITRRLASAMALLLACNGGDLVLPSEGEPAALEVAEGNGQSGRVGVALGEPIIGRVTDLQGRPVADVPVAFVFTEAGGATVAPDTGTTDSDGRASFVVVTGPRVGGSSAELRVGTGGGQRTLTAAVAFTAVSADANELRLVGGDNQSAAAGAVLAEPLVVQVTDAFGNPIPGVPITWTPDAGGSVSEETTPTGEDGLASVVRTLGSTAGLQYTVVSAPGLAGSPATFTHTAGAGAATVLELVSGNGQVALVGTSTPEPLVVRARDGSGNPVPGLAVAWLVGDGSGSLAPETSITDGSGIASTLWTLGTVPGANTATAVISGVGIIGFSATATPGTPPALSLDVQPPAAAVRGVVLTSRPVVRLRDPAGAPIAAAGVEVSVVVVEGGATLLGTLTRGTDVNGRSEFTDLALVGPPGTYTLAFSAAGYTGVNSSPIALTRAPTSTTIRSDDPDPSAAGAAVRVRFQVQSPGGTPTGSVRVSATDGASCTGAVSVGECTLTLTGVGTQTLTAAYSGDTQFEGSAGTASHVVEAAALIPTTTTIISDDPERSSIGQVVTVVFTVTAAGATPTGTVTVVPSSGEPPCSVSVQAGSCPITFTTDGTRSIFVTYGGGAGFAGSADTATHVVLPGPPAGPSASQSSVNVESASIALGGSTGVVVTVRSAAGTPLAGVSVALTSTGTGNTISPAPPLLTNAQGQVRFGFSSTDAGSKTFTATAAGVTIDQRPTVTVAPAGTATAIISHNPEPSTPGAPITVGFRVTVTSGSGAPTGTVNVSSSGGGTCSGTVSGGAAEGACTLVAGNAAGTVTLTAAYAGTANFAASSDSDDHEIAPPASAVLALVTQPSAAATSGVAFSQQPVVQLRNAGGGDLTTPGVAVTAAIASGGGAIGGTVTQSTDGSGRATFTNLSIGGTGSHTLRFTAAGYTGVTSETIDVQPPPPASTNTVITSNTPNPSDVGQAVNVAYNVSSTSGVPSGTVTVTASGGSESCTASVAAAGCSIVLTAPGARSLTATYGGSSGFAASSGTAAHTVNTPPPPGPSATQSTVTVADATIGLGGSTGVVVTVRNAAGAVLNGITVTLSATGTGNTITPASVNTNAQGEAAFTFSSFDAGTKTLSAVAGGVTLASQPQVTVAQGATTTTITSDTPEPSAPGAAVNVQFTVASGAGTPAGTVAVTASGGGSCQATVAQAGCSLTPSGGAGTVTLTASYPGNANFTGSSDTEAHTIEAPPPPELSLSTQPSATATSGVPLGQQPVVQLQTAGGTPLSQSGVTVNVALSGGGSLGGTTSGSTDGNGRVAFSDLAITGPAGSYSLSFTASGFTPVNSNAIALSAAPTTTTIVSDDPDPSLLNQPVTVQFTVTSSAGSPSGSVTVEASASETCTATVAEGSCDITLITSGDRTLTASYAGASGFEPSSDTEGHAVIEVPPTP